MGKRTMHPAGTGHLASLWEWLALVTCNFMAVVQGGQLPAECRYLEREEFKGIERRE